MNYTPPFFRLDAFHCIHCQVYTHHLWHGVAHQTSNSGWIAVKDLSVCFCIKCRDYSVWYEQKLIFPATSTAPMPSEDMPEDVKADYMEAREVAEKSPRSAAALLRLAIQKLMPHVGEKGGNINDDIKNLVAKGLPALVQKSLDTVRVIGNNAVHPGQLDLKDDTKTANALFNSVNFIVQQMITQPKQINEMFGSLPQTSKDAIDKRDGKRPAK